MKKKFFFGLAVFLAAMCASTACKLSDDPGVSDSVTLVIVRAEEPEVEAGGEPLQFTATVEPVNTVSQKVMWSILTTGTSPGTSIDPYTGLLTVARDETKTIITVTAVSVENSSKSGKLPVYVIGGPDSGQTYTVTFYTGENGLAVPSQSIVSGRYATSPTPRPTMAGHNLVGWYKDDPVVNSNAALWDFTNDPVTDHITLFAKWEPADTWTVTFDSDGGSPNRWREYIVKNSCAIKPADPTKTNCVFDGWYITEEGEEGTEFLWNFTTEPVTKDITLKAHWIEYITVKFEVAGGTPEPERQIIAPGGIITQPITVRKEGYTFVGWKNGEHNPWNFAYDTVTANDDEEDCFTLTAQWIQTTRIINISFDLGVSNTDDPSVNVADIRWSHDGYVTASVASESYTNQRWFIDGVEKTGADYICGADCPDTCEICAEDCTECHGCFRFPLNQLSISRHTITLLATKEGRTYSKEVTFRVTQ